MNNEKVMVSVIMSVYNTKEEYLRVAIESILNQTYKDFEFIIINDCSNTETSEIIHSYNDHRIIVINNSQNMGLTKSLNKGLRIAKGKYIARMDSDDISLETRLYEQLMYMEANKDISVLGAYTRIVGKGRVKAQRWPDNPEITKIRLLFCNAGIIHPTAFFRKEHLDKYDIWYDESLLKSQDYAMWVKIMEKGKIDILPRVLLEYRVHEDQISIKDKNEQAYYANIIMLRQLDKFKYDFTEKEKAIFCELSKGNMLGSLKESSDLINRLIEINDKKELYNKKLFRLEIIRIWVSTSIRRIRKFKKFDMFFSRLTFKILIPSYLLHWLRYFFIEHARIRCLMYKLSIFKDNFHRRLKI